MDWLSHAAERDGEGWKLVEELFSVVGYLVTLQSQYQRLANKNVWP